MKSPTPLLEVLFFSLKIHGYPFVFVKISFATCNSKLPLALLLPLLTIIYVTVRAI